MVLFFAMYTFVVVLSLIFPAYLSVLLGVSIVLTCGAYLLHVYAPMFFSGFSMWVGPGLFLIPVPIMIIAAILVPQKNVILWVYYAVTVFFGVIIPLGRYLHIRLSLYRLLRKSGKCSLYSCLFAGRKTPLYVSLDTKEGKCTIGILGNPWAMRYFVTKDSITAQRIRALAADILPEIEKKEDSALVRSLLLPLMGRKRNASFACAEGSGEAYLLVHPGCVVYNEEKPAETGDCVGGYHIASLKYIRNTVRRLTENKEKNG
ncbi:MAG: hypothetical protein E7662_12670 [Ruminococcaceae bacterium]|nr:hypothetical protein [Oscillospiraceae bacterium]